ncbi:hypothetical protein [Burkholderia gladioli]|uniref:hypothetical protein n=1 Tax=Burkholderia gladioli TaxID=28095 RepID=UPI000303AF8A|nr:hypothetical protein [Burkholderia gladioli]
MKMFDHATPDRQTAIAAMHREDPASQSDFPPVPQFESSRIFRSTVALVILVALASALADDSDQSRSVARALHQRVTV